MLVPELHTPLQQPTFVNNVLTVGVQYSRASPSLSGGYVFCSQSETPFLCGGWTTISVTSKTSVEFPCFSDSKLENKPIQKFYLLPFLARSFTHSAVPSLSISTQLLVSQYVEGNEVNNVSPEIVCQPSDPRAPVSWSTLPVIVDLERNYNAVFDPPGLNHTLRFPTYYRQLPMGTLRVVCDLINADQPGEQIAPMTATVVFVESKWEGIDPRISLLTATHVLLGSGFKLAFTPVSTDSTVSIRPL